MFHLTLKLTHTLNLSLTHAQQPLAFWQLPGVEDSDNNSDDDTKADSAFEEQERLHFLREASIFAA